MSNEDQKKPIDEVKLKKAKEFYDRAISHSESEERRGVCAHIAFQTALTLLEQAGFDEADQPAGLYSKVFGVHRDIFNEQKREQARIGASEFFAKAANEDLAPEVGIAHLGAAERFIKMAGLENEGDAKYEKIGGTRELFEDWKTFHQQRLTA